MSSVAEQIEALSEAIFILYSANGRNTCRWAEDKLNRAVGELRKQQTALCEFHLADPEQLAWAERSTVVFRSDALKGIGY